MHSSRTLPVRYILITREPVGRGGKADSLSRIFTVGRDRSIIHVDDKKEIYVEFKGYRDRIAHIQVPRKPRPEGVKSFKNIDLVAEALQQEQAAQAGYHRR